MANAGAVIALPQEAIDHAYSNVRQHHSAGCIVTNGWLYSESGFRLDRAVPLLQTDKPIEDPLVTQIRQARLALASNDIVHSIQFIASATDTATHLASTQ